MSFSERNAKKIHKKSHRRNFNQSMAPLNPPERTSELKWGWSTSSGPAIRSSNSSTARSVPARRRTASGTRRNGDERESSSKTDTLLLEAMLEEIKQLKVISGSTGSGISSLKHHNSPSNVHIPPDEESLLARLVELEKESLSTSGLAEKVMELSDAIVDPKREGRSSKVPVKYVVTLRAVVSSLMERLNTFTANNRSIRSLLRQREDSESINEHLQCHRDQLLQQNAELMAMNKRFQLEVLEKDKVLRDLHDSADAQKEETLAIASDKKEIETTHARIQRQLHQKEADCNRMAVQIRQLEADLAQTRIDSNHACSHLRGALAKAESDKVPLKRAARAQKMRANRLAEEVEKLRHLFEEKEPLLEQLIEEEDYEKDVEEEEVEEQQRTSNAVTCCVLHDDQGVRSTSPFPSLSSKDVIQTIPVTDEERKAYDCLVELHKKESVRAEERMRNLEIRLRSADNRNRSITNQLADTTALLDGVRSELREAQAARQREESRMDAVQHERDALQERLEAAVWEANNKRKKTPSYSERKLRERVSSLQEKTERLQAELELQQRQHEDADRESADHLAEMTSKLRLADANQRNLQRHLQMLKSSYNKCFGTWDA